MARRCVVTTGLYCCTWCPQAIFSSITVLGTATGSIAGMTAGLIVRVGGSKSVVIRSISVLFPLRMLNSIEQCLVGRGQGTSTLQ